MGWEVLIARARLEGLGHFPAVTFAVIAAAGASAVLVFDAGDIRPATAAHDIAPVALEAILVQV